MPVKTWATNDVPTASDLNTQYRDQVISTVTSGTRPSGTEGQMIYETDTDLCYIYNGGWVRFGASAGWTSFTPTLTQSSAVTKTVNYAKYEKIGRLVIAQISVSVTGTGVANNTVTCTLPFTAASVGGGNMDCGSGHIFDASAATNYPGVAVLNSVTTVALLDATAGTAVLSGQTGAAFSAAIALSDGISMCVMYEATS